MSGNKLKEPALVGNHGQGGDEPAYPGNASARFQCDVCPPVTGNRARQIHKMSQPDNIKGRPEYTVIGADQAGRRVDNFLISCLNRIPKSRIYQMLRRGEVRINGGRVKADYRVQAGDEIRIPPVFEQASAAPGAAPAHLVRMMKESVLFEDDRLVVVNKPAGLSVHAGTGSYFGVIELLRELFPGEDNLHLVHRLDKETSGCLLVAKNMRVLRRINQALKSGKVRKEYDVLLKGRLRQKSTRVDSSLQRYRNRHGEGKVRLDVSGKTARSDFQAVTIFTHATRARVSTGTGRTHQVRVHAASLGHPLAGDGKYGDREFNRKMRALGLKRMFLHAGRIAVPALKATGEYRFNAPLPAHLEELLKHLAHQCHSRR